MVIMDQIGTAVHAALSGVESQNSEQQACMQNSREPLDFDELVRPLEIASASRLNEPARTTCRVAFAAHPEGCRLAARNALKRGGSNPVGLFCRMIRDGDHQHLDEALAHDGGRSANAEALGGESTWRLEVIWNANGSDVVSYEAFDGEPQCLARRMEVSALADVVETRVIAPRGAARGRGRTAREIFDLAEELRRQGL